MELTRRMFFKTAVNFLYTDNGQNNLTYRQCIEKAESKYGITHAQLKELCRDGVKSIEV